MVAASDPRPAAPAATRRRRRRAATPRSATPATSTRRIPPTLQQGGNLRLALTDVPVELQLRCTSTATLADAGALLRSTMPRAFRVASDGSTTVNTDYFTNVELTSTNPQVVTYTINPKAVWSDGTPITWEDIAVPDQRDQRQGQGLRDRQPQRRRPRREGDPRRRRPPGRHHLRQAVRPTGGACSPATRCCCPRA